MFQGPIFDDTIDLWADDVQIPSSFWKIVVWKGEKALKAVGMVVDQLALLSEERKSLGTPQPSPSVNVSHWRVAITQIEKRTGLDFGKALRKADTIARADQPVVGEEALTLIPIQALSDIALWWLPNSIFDAADKPWFQNAIRAAPESARAILAWVRNLE